MKKGGSGQLVTPFAITVLVLCAAVGVALWLAYLPWRWERAKEDLRRKHPSVRRINVDGTLHLGVYAKDVILHIIAQLGAKGGIGYAYEYGGSVVDANGEAANGDAQIPEVNVQVVFETPPVQKKNLTEISGVVPPVSPVVPASSVTPILSNWQFQLSITLTGW